MVAVISGRDFFAIDLVDSASRVMFEIRAIPGVAEVTDAVHQRVRPDLRRQPELAGHRSSCARSSATTRPSPSPTGCAAALHRIDAPEVLVGGELLAERDLRRPGHRGRGHRRVDRAGRAVRRAGHRSSAAWSRAACRWPPPWPPSPRTLLALTGLAGAMPVSEYAVNVVTLLGIGLAVDYSLLILSRFREERAADPRRAGAGAARPDPGHRRAGRPDLRAGRGRGAGGPVRLRRSAARPRWRSAARSWSLLATLAGLTLVPALIAVAHRRIPAPGHPTWVWRRPAPRAARGCWPGSAAFAQRRPARGGARGHRRAARAERAAAARQPRQLRRPIAAGRQRGAAGVRDGASATSPRAGRADHRRDRRDPAEPAVRSAARPRCARCRRAPTSTCAPDLPPQVDRGGGDPGRRGRRRSRPSSWYATCARWTAGPGDGRRPRRGTGRRQGRRRPTGCRSRSPSSSSPRRCCSSR